MVNSNQYNYIYVMIAVIELIYSYQIFLFCQHILICECNKPFNEKLWKHINNNGYSSRKWMKEYERLKSNGELDFIERYKRRG